MTTATVTPSSVPVLESIAREVILFKPPVREFVLFNARKKTVETMYVGNLMTIPAVNVVNEHHSDTDEDGDPIPGTYVVRDLYHMDQETGDEKLVLDAARAIAHILGVHKAGTSQAAVATSPLAVAGLSVLPRHASKELIREARESGSQLGFLADVQQARNVVEAASEINSKRKSMGMDPVPAGHEYARALSLLREYNRIVEADVKREAEPAQDAVTDAAIDEEMEMMAIARAKAMEMADKYAAGKTLDKEQLFKELMNDPSVRAYAQKAYRFRKKGHQQISQAELEAAAAAGLFVADLENDSPGTETESAE